MEFYTNNMHKAIDTLNFDIAKTISYDLYQRIKPVTKYRLVIKHR
jgi:hypothetical protein